MNPNPSLIAGASAVLSLSSSMDHATLGAAIHEHFAEHPEGSVKLESVENGETKTVTIRVSQDGYKPDLIDLIAPEPPHKPHVNIGRMAARSMSSSLPLALLSAAAGAAIGGPFGGILPGFGEPSASDVRNDPERVKTPEDLARIEAARAKQARKAAKRAARK